MSDKNKSKMSDHYLYFIAVGMVLIVIAKGIEKMLLKLEIYYLENFYFFNFSAAILLTLLGYIIWELTKAKLATDMSRKNITEQSPDSVYCGKDEKNQKVFVKDSYRRMHTQVVGTTNAGKTESVIVPWAVDDLKRQRGFIIIDGKSDKSLLEKIYAYAKKYKREHKVRILSICNPEISHTFNPFANGSALEVTERVFKALTFENEYFKYLQYQSLLQVMLIFETNGIKPTPIKIVDALRSNVQLTYLATTGKNKAQLAWVNDFMALSREEREQRTSGLVAQLQSLCVGETSPIFNAEFGTIDLENALANNEIIYCQLPVLKIPTLGKVVGKLILQNLQSAIASRHLGKNPNKRFFSVYLDDFTEYLTEGFVSLLNKSRSANVAIVMAHQALGDLATLGEAVKNTLLTNTNLKVFMRANEPDSTEYFSKVIGTSLTDKVTERQKNDILGSKKTGDGSVREVEEFKFHPNLFKQELGVGEAVVILPHEAGTLPLRMKFSIVDDIYTYELPKVPKEVPIELPPVPIIIQAHESGQKKMEQLSNEAVTSAMENILAVIPTEKELS